MNPPDTWSHLPFFRDNWPDLAARLGDEDWLPGDAVVFRALELVPPRAVRVIILAQDPYPTPGHADGLAFSVRPNTAFPPSLRNIFKEMREDLGRAPASGDLTPWAQKGVLLLNTCLSTPPRQAGGHLDLGWEPLTRQVVSEAQQHGPIAFLLWGCPAQQAVAGLPRAEDFVIATTHPSPRSAWRTFFGSRPFSRVNDWLCRNRPPAIDWTGG